MEKYENMNSYLTWITQLTVELATIGEVVQGSDLVRTAMNGVTKQWGVFVDVVIARENMFSWDHIWDDFVQEETPRNYV